MTEKIKIKKEISSVVNKIIGKNISAQRNFLQSGVIDSFSYVELLINLENKFKIKIKKKEQMDIRLQSIEGLIKFVSKKINAKKK